MKLDTPVLLTCSIGFRPRTESGRKRIRSIVQEFKQDLSHSIGLRWLGDNLRVTGIGFDGRCALCRGIRLKAKSEGIVFSTRCRYETDDTYSWRVRAGGTSYDITLIESEGEYLRRKQANPDDIVARTHLGVIAESRGELALALHEYLSVLKHRPKDAFTRKRVQEVSNLLLKQKRAERQGLMGFEHIATS